MNENTKNALNLLQKESTGILSTHSLDVKGYPFGSVTPYCLDKDFHPIILISEIAQHTKNIDSNSKVSLTVTEQSVEAEKQALGRVTLLSDAKRVTKGSLYYKVISEIYLRYFPAAKQYFEAHNFYFYRLEFVRIRFIRGFGQIFWVERNEWKATNVFQKEELHKIIGHMNADHQDALKKYCKTFKNLIPDSKTPLSMIGLYQYGFDLLYGKEKLHFSFEREVCSPEDAREQFIAMAKS